MQQTNDAVNIFEVMAYLVDDMAVLPGLVVGSGLYQISNSVPRTSCNCNTKGTLRFHQKTTTTRELSICPRMLVPVAIVIATITRN
jgi:hypothetical protein